ncbi:unnamed protein product [Prorocentrum cordatum]|uniref:CDP-alcohol phosphatidyltransferase n=1 Tax=Prorocentrum cordatum TaxID=2364126 RepID=A0ABN9T5V3_9DINO|nr:unnamed protein product [Polarella glacialis]
MAAPPCPGVHLLVAALMLAYQTLDAMDGKVARARKLSSPLGALLDHGLDALMIVLFTAITVLTMDREGLAGPVTDPMVFLGFFAVPAAWYCAQVDQALSGVMDTRGITEAEFIIVGVCLATAALGPEAWSTELLVLGRRTTLCRAIFSCMIALALLSEVAGGGPGPRPEGPEAGNSCISVWRRRPGSPARLQPEQPERRPQARTPGGVRLHAVHGRGSACRWPHLWQALVLWGLAIVACSVRASRRGAPRECLAWAAALLPLALNGAAHAACAAWSPAQAAEVPGQRLVAQLGYAISGTTFGAIAVRLILSSQFCGRGVPGLPWAPLLPCALGALVRQLGPAAAVLPVLLAALAAQLAGLAAVFVGVCLQVSRELGVPVLSVPAAHRE